LLPIFSVVNAFFWRLTGAGCGPWRKIGWPSLVGLYGLLNHAPWLQVLLAPAIALLAVTLPFTLIGSKISDHWFNWLWIWILAFLFCFPMFAYSHWNFFPMFWALAATLSNIKATEKTFVWEFCECLCGFTVLL
jgi:hypothetical protein